MCFSLLFHFLFLFANSYEELSKRIAIFYSACYAASMFSGYLQAGIYSGMDGHLGLAGWRWLFIFCGVISLPFSLYGYIAIPDNPYICKARWLSPRQVSFALKRMEAYDRRPPVLLSWAKIKRVLTHWPLYAFTAALIFQCVATQPLNYFAVWLKALNRFSVYQVNLIPTAGQAVGLVTTLAYSWVSDSWDGNRWGTLLIPGIINLVGMILVAIGPGFAATLVGYLLNGASWGFWPILFVCLLQKFTDLIDFANCNRHGPMKYVLKIQKKEPLLLVSLKLLDKHLLPGCLVRVSSYSYKQYSDCR